MNRQRMLLLSFFILFVYALSAFALPHFTNAPKTAVASPESTSGIHINEVLFKPTTGSYEWVELHNGGVTAVNIQNYTIRDEDGNSYSIPAALPSVPGGAFVLIIFDGSGSSSDDYDFGDNVATLHTPAAMTDIFEDDSDQVALYRRSALDHFSYLPITGNEFIPWNPIVPGPAAEFPSSPLVDFVAWGAEPGADAAEANIANVWNPDWYVNLYRGLGEADETLVLAENESIGLLPGSQTSYPEDWALFLTSEVTPGAENSRPGISWYYPTAGATLDSATFSISWASVPGATGYQFQLDNNNDFSSPEVDTVLAEPHYTPGTAVPEGTHYWRVKVQFDGGSSPWSAGVEVNSLALPAPLASHGPDVTVLAFKVLGIPWQLQHKDTNMLCLDGDPETGNLAWNSPHNNRGTHGNNYCVRASISMMASYYGGALSQDRITYEIFKGGGPEGDLGHNVGVAAPPNPLETNTLSWALGTPVTIQAGKPTFNQIKAWIDNNQPLMARIPGHMRVIDGYFEFTILTTTWQFIHLLDPWDNAKWVDYASDNIAHVWPGPSGSNGAPNVRSDEDIDGDNIADTVDDSDNDGVSDFDERNRFNLNPNLADTDNDLVNDLPDIREYVFDATGNYSLRNADIDGDGQRKEVDMDNDIAANNGSMDGCEDRDYDGIYEPTNGETNNFSPIDDTNLHVRLTWPLFGSDVDLHLIRPGGAMWTSDDAYFANRNPDWGVQGVSCDDPTLDVDCITQCTVENIRLDQLENGMYSVKVHYYSDHDLGPTSPHVIIWLQGVRYDFGPTQITDDQVWDVATIDWETRTVTAVNSILLNITPLSENLSTAK